MPTRSYNIFYTGIKQDELLGNPGFIDGNNLTGLNTGQGITLGPKSNKLFTTNGAMRGLYVPSRNITPDNAESFAYGDNGEIYNFESTDLTPLYTVTTGYQVRGFTIIDNDFYFLHSETGGNTLNLGRSTNGFTTATEDYVESFIASSDTVPIVSYGDRYMFGGTSKIVSLPTDSDPAVGLIEYPLFTGTCQGIANHGNQLYLYNSYGRVDIWDGTSTALSGSNSINFPPRKVKQTANETYVTSRDGSIYKGSGWSFSPIIKYKKSKRLDDNTIYQDKFNFSGTDKTRGQYIANAGDTIYVGCNDGTPGIYIYDNIISGSQKGFHKAITANHEGTAIEEIYAIAYDHTQDRVFYSYKAGATYGVDYVSTVDRESATTGYGVTEVYTGGTSFLKTLNVARISVSNVDENNTADLYYRVNDGSWELLRTINSTTEGIYYRENITHDATGSAFKQFIDIQFKIVLTSANNDNTPPILNELMIDYTIINA